MKLKSLIFTVLLFASNGFAQAISESIPSPASSPDPSQTEYARDTVDHDPNPAPKLMLDEVVNQVKFAIQDIPNDLAHWFGDELSQIFRGYHHLVKRRPELFDLFKIHEDRYQPRAENGLALINADFDFEGISDRKLGYCWGFATLNRQFANLAFYDPNAKRESLEFYENVIDQIARGKAVIIPGFKNTREFSLVPEHEFYLKLTAMNLWRKYVIRPTSIPAYFRTAKQMQQDEVMDMMVNLKERLARHELPKLFISSKLQSGTNLIHVSKHIHIVLVIGVEQNEDGSGKITVWDGNFFAETLQREPKVIEVTKDGELIYRPWIEPGTPEEEDSIHLSRIAIPPENDAETVQQLFSLKKFCRDHESYCKSIQ